MIITGHGMKRTGRTTYLDILAPPLSLNEAQMGCHLGQLMGSADFFYMHCKVERIHLRKFKHTMM